MAMAPKGHGGGDCEMQRYIWSHNGKQLLEEHLLRDGTLLQLFDGDVKVLWG